MSKKHKIRIAIDAMGGDHAPFSVVAGAVLAQKTYTDDVELTLVGDSVRIRKELENVKAADTCEPYTSPMCPGCPEWSCPEHTTPKPCRRSRATGIDAS